MMNSIIFLLAGFLMEFLKDFTRFKGTGHKIFFDKTANSNDSRSCSFATTKDLN